MKKKLKISQKKINIIFALDEKNGIWKNWDLAWRIKEDMQYFKEITISYNKDKNFKNAVIMWRKTWDSIPEKYKPLPWRKNIILSRDKNFKINDDEILIFSDFDEAIKKINLDKNIWEIFIIWWASIYNLALKNELLNKIYLTRVKWNFDCDVFVDLDLEKFELIENNEWKKNNNWIEFRFEVYRRK
jgi:dihydrofolate reductase